MSSNIALKPLTKRNMRILGATVMVGVLAACQPGDFLGNLGGSDAKTATGTAPGQSVKLIERDVEAPDVYQTTDPALWDGRPSLGGVWVAAPGVKDPERVIIRNTANGKFVIGALFKRERISSGPPLQLSSDAAAALAILAGQPTEINVTALRREQVPDPAAAPATTAAALAAATAATGTAAPSDAITATPLGDDPIAAAASAIERAAPSAVTTDATGAAASTAAATGAAAAAPRQRPSRPSAARGGSTLSKPYVQIGIFSIEQNARNTATALRGAGILPTVLEQTSSGRKFWRVVVGPSVSSSDRASVLRTVKKLGFSDAYAVTN